MHEYVPTNHSPGGFLGVLSSSTLRRVWSKCSVYMLVGVAFEPRTSFNGENVLPGLNARSSLDPHIPAHRNIIFFTINQEIHAALKSCGFSLKMIPRKSSVI